MTDTINGQLLYKVLQADMTSKMQWGGGPVCRWEIGVTVSYPHSDGNGLWAWIGLEGAQRYCSADRDIIFQVEVGDYEIVNGMVMAKSMRLLRLASLP